METILASEIEDIYRMLQAGKTEEALIALKKAWVDATNLERELNSLVWAGVDNWSGFFYAAELLRDEYGPNPAAIDDFPV